MYPLGAPEINGSKITVEMYLKNPSRVARDFGALARERFVGDFIFAGGDAQGGAVVYDVVDGDEDTLYTKDDPQEIAPGDEFPLTDAEDPTPQVAKVTKRGSAITMTYEQVRRDQRDVLNRKMIRLRNTSVRKHDTIVMQTLHGANTIVASAGKPFSDPTGDPIGELFKGVSAVEESDLGYAIDTIIINPKRVLDLLLRKDIRDLLPKENASLNPILSGKLPGLAGIPNWIVTNRQDEHTVNLLQRQVAGSMRDELPLYTRVIDQPERERWLIQAGRVSVPIVTDPKAVYELRGV